MKLNFKKVEESRAGAFFMFLNYEGGDADTEHPEEYQLLGISANNYKDKLVVIEHEVNRLYKLQSALDSYGTDNNGFDLTQKEFGDDIAMLYDEAPNDPQADYQFKCILGQIKLVYYDDKGTRFESYVK